MQGQEQFQIPISPSARLFLVSLLVLFVELALIRWTSAQILYLGYFSNLALIGCILGIGLGLFVSEQRFHWISVAPFALLALLALVLLVRVEVLVSDPNTIYFTSSSGFVGLPVWAVVLPLFALLVLVFIGPSQEVGRLFIGQKPLVAYTWNIAGNLAGIAMFWLFSLFSVDAAVWFALAAVCFLFVVRKSRSGLVQLLVMFICAGVVSATDYKAIWSPYYRVEVHEVERETPNVKPMYRLKVNSIIHQVISTFREREVFYEFPYRVLLETLEEAPEVLIIGGGVGTDVSFGLAYAAKHIDAVEIDPVIADLGKELNPDQPYQNPRTTLIIDDGRSYMENTDKKYDLVAFGLPDSLSLVSSYSSVRLESFLFTMESFRSVRKVMKEEALFVAYNYFREEWLVERIAGMLELAFGEPPVVLVRPETNMTAVFFAGPLASTVPKDLGSKFGFERRVYPSPEAAAPIATDDWPFLYLKNRSLPGQYLYILGFVFGAALLSFWLLGRGQGLATVFGRNLHLFFTGAAFMLLEAASIVRGYVLFGSTWTSNAYVFGALLALILLANWIVIKRPPRTPYPLAVLLLVSLAVAYLVPLDTLLGTGALRYPLIALLMLSPVFFANLLFARFFHDSKASHLGLAANVTGAILGGLAEYFSTVVGYQSLYLLAALLYVGAVVSWIVLQGRPTKSGAASPAV